jgi:hypothetical protein
VAAMQRIIKVADFELPRGAPTFGALMAIDRRAA